jgi:hypothetical protein
VAAVQQAGFDALDVYGTSNERMKATRDPLGQLVVISGSAYTRVLIALAGVGVVLAWISRIPAREAVGWTAICLLFGAALVVVDERSMFIFDPRVRVLQWRRDTPFRHASGDVAFDAITALSIEHDFKSAAPSRGRGGARRLVLLTSDGPIPLTTAFSGFGSGPETVGGQIQQFLRAAGARSEISLRTP